MAENLHISVNCISYTYRWAITQSEHHAIGLQFISKNNNYYYLITQMFEY